MNVSDPVVSLTGVGPALEAKLAQLGIVSIGDLLMHWPRKYEDYSSVTLATNIQPGLVTLCGWFEQISSRYVRRGMHVTQAVLRDASGAVNVVWFNQPYRAAAIKPGKTYYVAGEYKLQSGRFAVLSPALEQADSLPLHSGRIVPIYRETKGLTSKQIRELVGQALERVAPPATSLPQWLTAEAKLLPHDAATKELHFPTSAEQLNLARRRMAFEEVFALSLASQLIRREQRLEKALPVPFKPPLAKRFVESLPFTLTNDQRAAAWQIYQDMAQDQPMNRLLEGDVGSGKTAVAAMAALMALAAGHQVAYLAPTELLARQQADSLTKLLATQGYDHAVTLLVGSLKPAQKKRAQDAAKSGQAGLVVGTHALLQEKVDWHRLGLIIVDEQHRFGVAQRQALMKKAGHMPHVLSLTATPIPRSLALTLYGELDLSLLKTKPAGRQTIITELVSPNSTQKLYNTLLQQIDAGGQVYVVCPLITDSTLLQAESAEAVYDKLRKGPLKSARIGLLHGKLKAVDKQAVMADFVAGKLDVLVSTTVIEVGVDVPNATTMVIMSPERFGLAQLHQLRGRVGRGTVQSYCYLLLSDSKAPSRRLRALESSSDGFRLSELDLEIRGPGAIYGYAQHGALDLRLANLSDTALIALAQKMATKFIEKKEDLLQYESLAANVRAAQAVTNLN